MKEFIQQNAESVAQELARPGGGITACLPATIEWRRRFEAAGILVVQLGRGFDKLAGRFHGGFKVRREEDLRDHHWLVVGSELTLFDPTGRQYAPLGAPRLDRYIGPDGQTLAGWRRARLG